MVEGGRKGTGRILIGNFGKNNPQTHLIKIRELTKNTGPTYFKKYW